MRGWAVRMSFDIVLSASELRSDRLGREDDGKQREYNHTHTQLEEQEGRAGGKNQSWCWTDPIYLSDVLWLTI